ncbi:uncharacterized protein CBL_03345 [Carabus blaptoides fortunei]
MLRKRLFVKRILFGTLKISLLIFFIVFFIGPLIFKFSYAIQRQVIFLNYINLPPNPDYNSPEKFGLNGTRNFYIQTADKVSLGVWHILPESLIKDNSTPKEYYESSLSNGEPVFIYMHGNSGNRAAGHRIELYKLLREKYHVIAFDYRSYGDSSKIPPTEMGVVKDAISVLQWVKNMTTSKIFIWGHSLGTGISTHALHILGLENIHIDGLILESPFNSIRQEVGEHPSAAIFRNMPWFKYTVVDALYNNGLRFESDVHIMHVDNPILIIHAEDDLVVPFKLGFKLYSDASKHRTKDQGFIQFEKLDKKHGYGHKYICRAPELPNIIRNFVAESLKTN